MSRGRKSKTKWSPLWLDRFFVVAVFRALGLGESGEGNFVAEVRFHELGKLGLQFFRCGKWRVLIHGVKARRERHALRRNLSSSFAM